MPTAARLAPAALAAALLAAPALAAEPGTWWEQTIEMQMAGFAMPATTMKVCLAKKQDWEKPPAAQKEQQCRTTDVKRSGSTMTWKLVCEGKERMEGEGQMTWTADSYDGKTTMRTAQGAMDMKMRGKKVGGDCDADEMKLKAEKMRKDGEAMQAQYQAQAKQYQAQAKVAMNQACDGYVTSMYLPAFTGDAVMCQEPDQKTRFCARLKTPDGLTALDQQAQGGRPGAAEEAAKFCGADLKKVRAGLCGQALAAGQADFVGQNCPAESKLLAQRECAGRSYTDVGEKYRSFCATYAADLMAKDQKKPAARKSAEDAAKDAAVEQGKKKLKGLLGF